MEKRFDQFDGSSTSEGDPSTPIGPQRFELQPSGAPAISSEATLFKTITERYIAEITSRSKDMEVRWNAARDQLHEGDYINHDLRSQLIATKKSAKLSKFMLFISFVVNVILCALIFLLIQNGTLSVDLIKKTIQGLV